MSQTRMHLRYGLNEASSWRHFTDGPERERIWAHMREIDTRIIRISLFEKYAPNPATEWGRFAVCVQAVLNAGATPMITFAMFPRPFDNPSAQRRFAEQCADVVWGCIEQWGGEVVRDWYWCVWNEPNSDWVSPDFSFDLYRDIYDQVARGVLRWLTPHLNGRKPLIGGPAVDGFQPFWWDWIWRFLNEVDNSLIGFVSWHRYGEWRLPGEWGAARNEMTHRALLMSRSADYEARARAVGRLLTGRGVLNICAKLNAHSYPDPKISRGFNQSLFGAAFYTSALLHLMRGGADAEMFWTGTDDTAGYGMMDGQGTPTPVFHAKRLCAQHVRYGDVLSFPSAACGNPTLDAVVAGDADGRLSGLLVHLRDEPARIDVAELDARLVGCGRLLKIDAGTSNQVIETGCDRTVSFDGYGVAVVTNIGGSAGPAPATGREAAAVPSVPGDSHA